MAMVYITYFIPYLSSTDGSIFQSIGHNEIYSSNTFYIFIFALGGVADGVINRKMSNDKSGLVRRPIIFDQLQRMKITFKSEVLFMKPIEKLRKAVKKIAAVFKLRNSLKVRKDPIEGNPLKRKYYFLVGYWIIVHLLVYMHLIYISTKDQNMNLIESIVSFFNNPNLRKNKEWAIIRIFYLLCICYMYVSISQIHYGKEAFSSLVVDMTLKENISNTLSDFTPFFREIGVVMDFLANKSSLQLRHKLRFNDVLYNIKDAKKQEIIRKQTSFGRMEPSFIKFVVGLVWFFLTVIILFGPLLPFTSIFNANKPIYIKDASMQVLFLDESGKSIGRLFETQTNVQTHDPSVITPLYHEYLSHRTSNSVDIQSMEVFELLTMSKQSETRSTLEDKFFSVLAEGNKEKIYNIISKGSLMFRLNVILKDNKSYHIEKKIPFSAGRSKEADELTNLLMSKCEAVNVKRTILIDKISQVYETYRKEDLQVLRRPTLDWGTSQNYFFTKLSINCVCDSGRPGVIRKKEAFLAVQ